MSPTATQTRNKNKEVEQRACVPTDPNARASEEELEGTGLSTEDFSSYLLVRQGLKHSKPFVNQRARQIWLARWRGFYAEGKDTTDMLGQMIQDNWIGPVDERWKKRKSEFRPATAADNVWADIGAASA